MENPTEKILFLTLVSNTAIFSFEPTKGPIPQNWLQPFISTSPIVIQEKLLYLLRFLLNFLFHNISFFIANFLPRNKLFPKIKNGQNTIYRQKIDKNLVFLAEASHVLEWGDEITQSLYIMLFNIYVITYIQCKLNLLIVMKDII